jgi:tetratricopeptide (TPR) repeat protein
MPVAIGLAGLVLTAIAWFRLRRTWPYIPIGCLWFFGMLVPVIGLLQIGDTSHADRYTYLSQIGLTIAVAWGVANAMSSFALPRTPGRRWLLTAVAWTPVLLLSIVAFRQAAYWRSDETLWSHATACDAQNLLPRFNLARAHLGAGKSSLAIRELNEAATIRSFDVLLMSETHSLLARTLIEQGDRDEGLRHYQLAVDIKPMSDIAHGGLARALESAGKHEQAIAEWRETMRLIPLGPARSSPETVEGLVTATHAALAASLLANGDASEAITECEQVLSKRPKQVDMIVLLADALAAAGRPDEAIERFEQVLSIEPRNADIHVRLAALLRDQGRAADALHHLDRAIELEGDALAIRQAAWLRATSSEAGVRDGAKAVELARRAVALSGTDPRAFDTLGAALAEAGDFEAAVEAAARAHELALAAGDAALAQAIGERIELYRRHEAYEEGDRPQAKGDR